MMTGDIQIVDFTDELAEPFRLLNLAWITKYFEVEPADEKALGNPRRYIIDQGGFIYFLKLEEHVVATFALLLVAPGVYELSKMAVAESWQNRKLGNALMQFCIAKAEEMEAGKLILYTNTILHPAIHLYKKFGFVEVPIDSADYKRANLKMELELNTPNVKN